MLTSEALTASAPPRGELPAGVRHVFGPGWEVCDVLARVLFLARGRLTPDPLGL